MNRHGYRVQEESSRLQDADTISQIDELVAEQHRVRAQVSLANPLTADDRRHLDDLQAKVDEHWSVLRRRRSRRYLGEDPDSVATEP